MSRDEVLSGPTYQLPMDDDKYELYVTVNQDAEGKPYEVFLRYDKAEYYEWMVTLSTQISRQLQAGVPLNLVAKDLQEIHSPVTQHHIPGGGGSCPSLSARIGMILQRHHEWLESVR